MEDGGSLLPVLLVVGLAFVVPLILQRFRRLQIPVVVGEIIAGMVIGRSGLNWVVDDPVLEVLAALGFAFLMFLSGLEIDFTVLAGLQRKSNRLMQNPVVVGTSILVLTIALAFGIAFTLSALGLVRNPWLPTLILSTTSLGIVLPVLREKGISSGQFGQTILLAALIADFVKLMNAAAGTFAGMTREAREGARERLKEAMGGLDFVSREEFDAVKAMAAKAREENEALKVRIAALEERLGKTS